MPELPEVEVIAREMRAIGLIGRTIVKVACSWPRTLGSSTVDDFSSQIHGQSILHIARRGKFLILKLTKDSLLIHLRMTGRLSVRQSGAETSGYERVALQLDDGRWLIYEDPRKFGRWYLVPDPGPLLAKLGQEPLSDEFTIATFKDALAGRRQCIKPLLLGQTVVAGLGNIYVDEALWEAKLHPLRPASSLNHAEITALHRAIRKVVQQGIAKGGTSLGQGKGNYYNLSGKRGGNQKALKVYRQQGKPCPRCGSMIMRSVIAQRGTHFCPSCQN